ncbi:PadR family transcriptional regulator [Deinococcus ruber]|uniref:PadR family transcriptional regulator n=1 Tax=Deinococcus ruber TaxID=1848197 RepID=A0A918F7X5_9DEIO|nr:PadR family transcriptional regulator [Deinococcus ruber]GGR17539.1 PadR family transcriptional regulator [Deinococcus ruber]
MPPTPQLNTNALQVMAVMYHDPNGQHYALSLSQATHLRNGTLFPILDKLEDMRLIEAEWEEKNPHGRRARRFYRLTAEGIQRFEDARAKLFTPPGGHLTHG